MGFDIRVRGSCLHRWDFGRGFETHVGGGVPTWPYFFGDFGGVFETHVGVGAYMNGFLGILVVFM